MFGKIILVLGILGLILGIGVVGAFIALPFVSHMKWEEAMFGIVPGAVVLLFSFPLAVVGLILVIKNKKKS